MEAADGMSKGMPIIEKEIKRKDVERESLGTVVAGIVYGDLHTIGKIIVVTLFTTEGFTVYDSGVNIKAEEFIEVMRKYKANILASLPW